MSSIVSIKDITLKNINGRTVLGPVTSLTHKNCEQLDRFFKNLIAKGVVDIVIDMKSVPLLDSCALELLVEMQSQLKKKGRNLIISDMNDVCTDILVCVKLINEFKIITTKSSKS
jgi:anti-anti-sigma factor